MSPRKRVIIFDDAIDHAEDVRNLLVSVTPPQWRHGGSDFGLTSEEIDVAVSTAPFIATWLNEASCDYELVVCDIHMGGGASEGALPVLKALGTLAHPPLLLVMTERIARVDDSVRHEIEDLARDPKSSVLCVVMSKHKSMKGVRDPDSQLDKAEWRDIFIRAVVSRQHPAEIKRLQRESSYYSLLQRLPTLKQAFAEGAEAASQPLIVVISEPSGLLGSFAGAWNNKVTHFFTLLPERFEALFLEDPWIKMPRHDAICVEDAELILRHAFLPGDQHLQERLQFLMDRRIVSRPGTPHATTPFEGQIILQATPALDAELSARPSLYRNFPKVHIPTFSEFRANMVNAGRRPSIGRADLVSLVEIMLAAERVVAESFDVAVMAAYDWSLGFSGQYTGVKALRECAQWMSRRAEDGHISPGLVIEKLTQGKEGRQSIYSGLSESQLLLYILERLAQVHGEPLCLQAAAFLYFKLICTTGEAEERTRSTEQFWQKGRLFGKNEGVRGMQKGANGWPIMADSELYAWRDRGSLSSKSIAARLQERLAKDLGKHVAEVPLKTGQRIMKLWSSGDAGRKNGENQLGVLDEPYKAERNLARE